MFLANGDLAWLAMSRPGFEADRFALRVREAASGKVRALAADWDRSIGHLATTFDRKRLLVTTDDVGQVALFEVDPASDQRKRLVGRGQVAEFAPARSGIVVITDCP